MKPGGKVGQRKDRVEETTCVNSMLLSMPEDSKSPNSRRLSAKYRVKRAKGIAVSKSHIVQVFIKEFILHPENNEEPVTCFEQR